MTKESIRFAARAPCPIEKNALAASIPVCKAREVPFRAVRLNRVFPH